MLEQHTKTKILIAAAELISSQGYYNVSVREICEAAGVTKPVLYYYFKDKEDVLAELINESSVRFKELIDKHIKPDSPFEEKLEGLFNVYVSFAKKYPYLIRISVFAQLLPLPEKIKSLTSKRTDESREIITAIFEEGREKNYFKKDIDIEMLVYSLIAPFGIFIAQTILFGNNVQPLKVNLKKYFEFWKSQFLNKEK